MALWYSRVTNDPSQIPAFVSHYEAELISSRAEVKLHGNLEKMSASLPGIVEYRFNQLQEIEAVLNYLNIQSRKLRKKHFQLYLEKYNRALSSRDAEKYADGEPEVIDMDLLINEVALLRNKYLGVMKALETKGYQINNVTRLRCAGLEDANI